MIDIEIVFLREEKPFPCYTRSYYEIKSPVILGHEELQQLRDYGKLGCGQSVGSVVTMYFKDNKFVYLVCTTCDSGD